MLQIRKQSWHYRLNKYTYGEESEMYHSLCPYFWGLLLAIISLPFVTLYRKVGGNFILGVFLGAVVIVVSYGMILFFLEIGATLFTIGVFTFFGFVVLLVIFASDPSEKEYKHKEKKTKKPNIAWEMLKATKNKYCPMIQVVD